MGTAIRKLQAKVCKKELIFGAKRVNSSVSSKLRLIAYEITAISIYQDFVAIQIGCTSENLPYSCNVSSMKSGRGYIIGGI